MQDTVTEPIIEGFICPNCMKSFGTANLLKFHFELDHKYSTDADHQKERKTRLNLEVKTQNPVQCSLAFYDQRVRSQPFGQSRSLLSEFTQIRRYRVSRDALETNSLLIRLEKLLQNTFKSSSERREFEQFVVPWIDAKVDLCPSCGQAFGLGMELAFPAVADDRSDDSISLQVSSSHINRLRSVAQRSKQKLTEFTNAILDYNPVFRRRHHCRLCGHVLCADCSFFLDKNSGLRILKMVNSSGFDSRPPDLSIQEAGHNPVFFKATEVSRPPLNIDQEADSGYLLRVCSVCKELLERKLARLEIHLHSSPLVQMHAELRKYMDQVLESLPAYTEIAESLHSGEQKYALEVAKNMRHELLESLQNIDLLRRKFEDLIGRAVGEDGVKLSGPINLASVRLARTIAQMARQFLQTNLPPLRALPTLQQYDSLAAQRKDELAARWEDEDRTLAELEQRVATATNKRNAFMPSDSLNQRATDERSADLPNVKRLAQIATAIDEISSSLVSALSHNQTAEAQRLQAELNKLEREFQTLSASVQNSII